MNNVLNITNGIDSAIQVLQKDLYDNLIVSWVDDLEGYGRIYKNIDSNSNKYIPQWWNSEIFEYVDVRYNDDVSGVFCFIDSDRHDTEDGDVFTSDVKCVFMLNLNKVLPSKTERADAKVQQDVINIIKDNGYGFEITGIEKGLQSIFSGFDTSKILNTDLQPKHCFSINIKLSYQLNCN